MKRRIKKVVNWIRGEIKEQGLLSFLLMCLFMVIAFPFFILYMVGQFFDWLNEKSKGLVGEVYE